MRPTGTGKLHTVTCAQPGTTDEIPGDWEAAPIEPSGVWETVPSNPPPAIHTHLGSISEAHRDQEAVPSTYNHPGTFSEAHSDWKPSLSDLLMSGNQL